MHVMNVGPDGSIECLHTDALPLGDIGSLTVRRASSVDFNESTQLWEVRWPGSDAIAFSNPSRSVCIGWEVETINAQLLAA